MVLTINGVVRKVVFMNDRKIINYLEDCFGQIVNLGEVETDNYPLYMKNEYLLQRVKILDKMFVLVMIKSEEEQTIEKLISRKKKLTELFKEDISIVFIFNALSDYMRKRLVEEHVAFVIPGKQIFILEIGSVFTDRINSKYSSMSTSVVKKMSPSSQGLLLYLLNTEVVKKSMAEIAVDLELSIMSVSRGFLELRKLGLIDNNNEFDVKNHKLSSPKKEAWEKAIPFMNSPVLKTIYVNEYSLNEQLQSLLVLSGESALSEHSMLSKPKHKVMGVYNKDYVSLFEDVQIIPIKEFNTIEIQIFKHKMFSQNGILNELSTALTLVDEEDERVKIEIEKMLNDYFMGRI